MGISTESRGSRLASFRLADFPFPTGREEEWRFTPLADLAGLLAGDLAAETVIQVQSQAGASSGPSAGLARTGAGKDRPGRGEAELDDGEPGEVGVRVTTAGRDHPRIGLAPAPGDRVAAAAWAASESATLVTLDATAAGSLTVVRVIGGDGSEPARPSATHLAILAGAGARGTVLLEHTGLARLAQGVEIILEEGADLTVIAVHDWAEGSVHAASHRIRLGRDAHLKHVTVALGGDLVRVTPHIELAREGASLDALGINVTDSGQHHEAQLFIDHAAPNCRSRVAYKGALLGPAAHSVWIGDVLIRSQAEGTDTYELNRNLVLAKGAHADSVPNLEIETGRIQGAGHASATGRFDEEQLFYLQSRGIPEELARSMVVHAFFAELIGQIGCGEVEDALKVAVDAKLDQRRNTHS
ncbi:MAG: SufD family Fe-S cluster assembly protein [Bifidobacteriaceae bacterium]|jgi:Fe-S cluster assembly protein SufD|nr:SufD family Fe-S cluster assembly protein [Bifidobacteriaceae bacterium]